MKRQNVVFRFAFWAAVISFIGLLAILGLQMYVRWALNQNFTFLGGFELEALTASVFALIATLAVVYRPQAEEEIVIEE